MYSSQIYLRSDFTGLYNIKIFVCDYYIIIDYIEYLDGGDVIVTRGGFITCGSCL